MENITIEKVSGLQVSERVLNYLESELRNIGSQATVDVDVFKNGREAGYVYKVMAPNGKSFSWCSYEYRSSDTICINGREGYYIGDSLPYCSDTSSDYLKGFDYNDEAKAANWLANQIDAFWDDNQKD